MVSFTPAAVDLSTASDRVTVMRTLALEGALAAARVTAELGRRQQTLSRYVSNEHFGWDITAMSGDANVAVAELDRRVNLSTNLAQDRASLVSDLRASTKPAADLLVAIQRHERSANDLAAISHDVARSPHAKAWIGRQSTTLSMIEKEGAAHRAAAARMITDLTLAEWEQQPGGAPRTVSTLQAHLGAPQRWLSDRELRAEVEKSLDTLTPGRWESLMISAADQTLDIGLAPTAAAARPSSARSVGSLV